jgi:2-polyprenyl-3-methyl-5-hydroxy-6-metoxy-1,4-benzoquinol methylase
VLTPARRRGIEILDDPAVDAGVRTRSTGDITRSNRWLGGLRAAVAELRRILPALGSDATLLDVGTGLADIPRHGMSAAADTGTNLATIGVDVSLPLLSVARGHTSHMVCADARALPFRDQSIDVVMCSQFLHHFEEHDAEHVVRELDRVARRAVIIADLRRSWIAAAGFWLVSFPMRFHPVTRHDGVVSVMRGFTAPELRRIVRAATGATATVSRYPGFRLTARWMRPAT